MVIFPPMLHLMTRPLPMFQLARKLLYSSCLRTVRSSGDTCVDALRMVCPSTTRAKRWTRMCFLTGVQDKTSMVAGAIKVVCDSRSSVA